MSQSRQLAAIVFTDIVGFSTLMGNDEQKTLQILEKNRQIHMPVISNYNGRWIKELGDGVMASFGTVTDAVNAAIKIMEACNAANEYQLCIGIHSAEVVFENDDVFGDGVNIAARIQSAAAPGCIFISESVQKNISNKKDIKTHFVQEAKLKNVSHPVRLYQLVIEGSELVKPPKATIPNVENSIAVLPFLNMSSDPEQEFFSDGMSEEIINMLAQVPDLKVTGRTSSFAFKGRNLDLQVIGEQLKANYLLEGSVRKSGNKLRITAQLIQASNGYHMYSEKFDRELEDVFAIQDEISLAILNVIELKLLGKEKEAVLKRYTENVEAYELFLQGLYHYNQLTPFSMAKAIDYYQSAIGIDPNYAIAYAEMGSCYWDLAYFLWAPGVECLPKALPAINKALRLDPQNDVCHIAIGRIQLWYEWNFGEAAQELEKGIQINPNNVEGLRQLGALNLLLGNYKEGHEYIKKALDLDPFSLLGLTYMGMYLWFGGFFDKMLEIGNKSISIEPNFFGGHQVLGVGYLGLHQFDKAVDELKIAAEMNPDMNILSLLGMAYALNDRKQKAEEIIERMIKIAYPNEGNAFLGYVYAGLKDWDKTYHYCITAAKNHEGAAISLPSIFRYMFPEILEDSRTKELFELIGLPT